MIALASVAVVLAFLFVLGGWPALAVVVAVAALMVTGALLVLHYSDRVEREEL